MKLPGWRTALGPPVGLILALALAACGSGSAAQPCRVCAAELAQTRADTYATVAKRTYAEEVYGTPNGAAFHVISRISALLDGLTTGDYALARSAMHHQPIRHAVAVRVTRGGRTLIDVGLRFVVGGRVHALHNRQGTYLGRIEISIQDVIGFIRLIHRLTGCDVVVEGSTGQAMSSLAAASGVRLPDRGLVVVAGREYTVSSFAERGFAGEPLRVSILDPR
ncbi:MAG TPA: hypothetical protein VIJ51_14060 [Solirubrobacteraceae bacterium]